MAIKPTELRIGNYVSTPINGVTQLKWIQETKDWCEPIQLTKEWLLKFGFGQSEDHEVGHNTSGIVDFYYDYHFKRFRLVTKEGEEITLPHIQYVYQIQNLYFALTGNELVLQSAGAKV